MPAPANLDATSSGDPFTLILGGLWDMADNSLPLTNLVAPANRIKFLGAARQEPVKDLATDSDRPELTITPAFGFGGDLDQLTDSDLWRLRWDWTVASGAQQLDQVGYSNLLVSLFPVLWAVYQTLIGSGQALKGIKYTAPNSTSYYLVHAVRPGPIEVARDDPAKLHGLKGWAGTWPFYTDIRIDVLSSVAALVS